MQIIDGYTGESHVTSTQVAWYHEGTNGAGDQVLPVGEQFAPTVQDINTIIVGSGMALVGGIRCEIAKGSTEPVTISTGSAGYSRHDLICIRYTRNDTDQIENASLVVIEGTPAAYSGTDNAEDPAYNDGDIQEGASVRDFPIYRVPIIETAVETPVPLFPNNTTLADLRNSIEGVTNLLTGAFAVETYTGSIPTGQYYATVRVPISKAGYTPIGVVGAGSTIANLYMSSMELVDDGSAARVIFTQRTGATITTGTYTIKVLFAKTALVA